MRTKFFLLALDENFFVEGVDVQRPVLVASTVPTPDKAAGHAMVVGRQVYPHLPSFR
jgi:hypothetical protein